MGDRPAFGPPHDGAGDVDRRRGGVTTGHDEFRRHTDIGLDLVDPFLELLDHPLLDTADPRFEQASAGGIGGELRCHHEQIPLHL